MNGKHTIVAYNSVGIPYVWDTTIREVKQENGKVTVIHKPKGKQTFYKHTYTKDQELHIYEGWSGMKNDADVMVSFEGLPKLNKIPVLVLN